MHADETDQAEKNDYGLREPILATFPCNMPQGKDLSKMNFQIYQQERTQDYQKKVKRVIKAERKNVVYTASNFTQNVNERDQGCDYYIGVISSKSDEKLHLMKIQAPYQFV